jgi:hypothetical protein
MTISGRKGHWRTNSAGTRFWVSEHSVQRVNYTLSKRGSLRYVNGQRLLETRCSYCYEEVYYVSNINQKNVFFNTCLEPLTLHKCRKNSEIKTHKTTIKRTKKFLDANSARALDRRARELRALKEERNAQKRKIDYRKDLSDLYDKITASTKSFTSLQMDFRTSYQMQLLQVVTLEVIHQVSLFEKKHQSSSLPANSKKLKKQLRKQINFLHNLKIILLSENTANLPKTDNIPNLEKLKDGLENKLISITQKR